MFVFQWNSMRVGERVMVHDDLDAGFGLAPGIVKYVETRDHTPNDVTIRVDGETSQLVRPRRHAVHMLPLDRRFSCWRCDVVAKASNGANASNEANASNGDGQRAAA